MAPASKKIIAIIKLMRLLFILSLWLCLVFQNDIDYFFATASAPAVR